MIVYSKLARLLEKRNMQWRDLTEAGISVNMPTKFSNNRNMNTENIDKVCEFFKVQPGDIMSWIPNNETESKEEIEAQIKILQEKLKNK